MATKGQRIQELEMQVIDTEVERDAFAEMAGDYFVGLLTAVDLLQEQRAMLDFDNFLLAIANEAIGHQSEKIESLERTERQRQETEQREARSKAKLAEVRNTPSLVDWALVNVETTADGLNIKATPDRWGRKRVTTTQINSDGSNGATVAITKGKADLTFRIPVFGRFGVSAKITHTETGSTPDSPFVEIENKMVFKFKMGGRKHRVTITAGGEVRRGCGDWYANTYRSTTKIEYWCDSCQEWHYQDDFRTNVNTSPMTERRSGGCGGW